MNTILSLESYPAASSFLDRVGDDLEAEEARNSLILGISYSCRRNPNTYGEEDPYFSAVFDSDDKLVCAAAMTPPHGPVLYLARENLNEAEREGIRAIVDDLAKRKFTFPTIFGPGDSPLFFAQAYRQRTGTQYEIQYRQRGFQCRQVIFPGRKCDGYLRPAEPPDTEHLIELSAAFSAEAFNKPADPNRLRKQIPPRIERGEYYLWELDGKAVSLTGIGRPTQRSTAVGPVYTPPEFRGRGFASWCVAEVTQRLLDQGNAFCTLFTDLANPTSNKIYQQIGYQAVGDFNRYGFQNAETE